MGNGTPVFRRGGQTHDSVCAGAARGEMARAPDDCAGAGEVSRGADSRSGESDLAPVEPGIRKGALLQVVIETDGVGYNIRQ